MTISLVRTGKRIEFLNVGIGNPFFAHDCIWVRIDYDSAKKLAPSDMYSSCCTFTIDEVDKIVEFVNVEVDGVLMIPVENLEKLDVL